MNEYWERDIEQLDEDGDYYCRHIVALTTEDLVGKSEIAAELAWRDYEIDVFKHKLSTIERETAEKCVDMIKQRTLSSEPVYQSIGAIRNHFKLGE